MNISRIHLRHELRARFWVTLVMANLVLYVGDAAAHEFWLVPSTYQASAGDTVTLRAFVGSGFRGELKPFATSRAIRLSVHDPKVRDLKAASRNGDLEFGRFVARDPAGAVIAYQSNFTSIELEAEEFERYLELEGLEGPRRTRAKQGTRGSVGRERYARCPKTWISGRDLRRLLRPVGLPLELVPLNDPNTYTTLRVMLLYRKQPLPGALVRIWRQDLRTGAFPIDAATRDSLPPVAQARTDRDGVASLPVTGSGEWLISAVHMIPSSDRVIADWESYWASLTFARPSSPR